MSTTVGAILEAERESAKAAIGLALRQASLDPSKRGVRSDRMRCFIQGRTLKVRTARAILLDSAPMGDGRGR